MRRRALITRRADDGINAPVPQPQNEPFEPGEWRPTPPTMTPMVGPWLGFVDPLLLPSPTHIPLAGPPALDSAEYAAEFAEVRDYGGAVSARTPEQTATALFHTVAPRIQHLEAIRDQIADRDLDIVDSARALAVFNAASPTSPSPAGGPSTTSSSGAPSRRSPSPTPTATPPPRSCPDGRRCATHRPIRTT